MKHILFALALAACGNSEEAGRQSVVGSSGTPSSTSNSAPQPPPPPPPAAKPAPPPAPEPTTPAEIERARNQAMIDGKDKDVLKYCEMSKLDDKSNPQALLGCTLSACRIKDVDTAKRYSKPLQKAYLDQAKKVCAANQVGI
jgi:hypothetical protein